LDDLREIEDDGLSDDELTLGSWITTAKATPNEDLIEKARLAIARVLAGPTELVDRWIDSKHFEEWKLVVDDLSKRLSAGTTDNSRANA